MPRPGSGRRSSDSGHRLARAPRTVRRPDGGGGHADRRGHGRLGALGQVGGNEDGARHQASIIAPLHCDGLHPHASSVGAGGQAAPGRHPGSWATGSSSTRCCPSKPGGGDRSTSLPRARRRCSRRPRRPAQLDGDVAAGAAPTVLRWQLGGKDLDNSGGAPRGIHRHSPFMSSGRLPRSTSTGPSISGAARAAGGTRSANRSSAMKDEQSLILEGIPDAKEVYRINEYRLFW